MSRSFLAASKRSGKRRAKLIQLLMLTILLSMGLSSPALADEASPMTQRLCSSEEIRCAISFNSEVREAVAVHITITGAPNVEGAVNIFKLETSGEQITGIEALADSVPFRTSYSGYAKVMVQIPPQPSESHSGWVIASLADINWQNPKNIIGDFSTFGTRQSLILGDGYGPKKPINTALDMHIAGVVGGNEYIIEYLADDGVWRNISLDSTIDPDEPNLMILRYQIPQGLLPKEYQFRLLNTTDDSAVTQRWTATPAITAEQQPRLPILKKPTFGTAVAGTWVEPGSYTDELNQIAAGSSVLAGIGLIILPALLIRKRQIRWEKA